MNRSMFRTVIAKSYCKVRELMDKSSITLYNLETEYRHNSVEGRKLTIDRMTAAATHKVLSRAEEIRMETDHTRVKS